jgi:hypothetical protein
VARQEHRVARAQHAELLPGADLALERLEQEAVDLGDDLLDDVIETAGVAQHQADGRLVDEDGVEELAHALLAEFLDRLGRQPPAVDVELLQRHSLPEHLAHPPHHVVEERQQHIALALEVLVERGPRYPGRGADVSDRGSVEALHEEGLLGVREDHRPPLVGRQVAPLPPHPGHQASAVPRPHPPPWPAP